MAKCGSCQAPVVWVETESGKRMPIDRDPVPADAERPGNLIKTGVTEVMRNGRHETVPTVMVVKPDDPTPAARYISHFATCPNSKSHRKT